MNCLKLGAGPFLSPANAWGPTRSQTRRRCRCGCIEHTEFQLISPCLRRVSGDAWAIPAPRGGGAVRRVHEFTPAGARQTLTPLDVSASAPDRSEEALPPAAGHPSRARHRLEGADASHRPLSRAEWTRQEDNSGLHSNCTRACWLHVVGRPGGADRSHLCAIII